jgi:hypothetical protein
VWNYHKSGSGPSDHSLKAARAIGRPLKNEERVHHVDGNGKNNRPHNLVVCPSEEYHKLLHSREEALDECGNAGWKKCRYCKVYSDPVLLKSYNRKDAKTPRYYHPSCHRDAVAELRLKRKTK